MGGEVGGAVAGNTLLLLAGAGPCTPRCSVLELYIQWRHTVPAAVPARALLVARLTGDVCSCPVASYCRPDACCLPVVSTMGVRSPAFVLL